jgi:hypothetical protein
MSKAKSRVWNDRTATKLQRIEATSQNKLKQAKRRRRKAEAERSVPAEKPSTAYGGAFETKHIDPGNRGLSTLDFFFSRRGQ